jgi:threonine dehydrogenase-like Zn-dependent dehydrogenase
LTVTGVGVVTEIGSAVSTVKVGDRVIIPDFPDDGHADLSLSLDELRVFGLGAKYGDLGGLQGKNAPS